MGLLESIISRMPPGLAEQLAVASRTSPLVRTIRSRVIGSLKGRDGVVMSGPAQGLRFHPGQSDSRFLLGNFEPAIQAFLADFLRPGMNFFDVGANVGFLSVLGARLVGPAGEVHAFEPLPQNADQISYNARLNEFSNVTVHEVALSKEDTTGCFRVSERPTFGALNDSPIEVDKEVGTIEVPVRRLDGLCAAAGLRGPDVMKVDVEGSEIDFLLGAAEVLESSRPVLLIELHGTNSGVASLLRRASYETQIVGGGPIEAAPWAALAIATPAENRGAWELAETVCTKYRGR